MVVLGGGRGVRRDGEDGLDRVDGAVPGVGVVVGS